MTVKLELEEYLQVVPMERKVRIKEVHFMILDLSPDATVDIAYKMPTYRVGEGWVALANQKGYIPVYTCGYHQIESFKTKYPKIRTGKGCINFRDTDDVPISDLRALVKYAIEHSKPRK